MSKQAILVVFCLRIVLSGAAAGQQGTAQPGVKRDPVRDGMTKGALAGAGAMTAFLVVHTKSCGIGCSNGAPAWGALGVAGIGAGIGSIVGLVADLDADSYEPTRFFPARTSVRLGPTYTSTSLPDSGVQGSASAPGFSVAVQLSPHVTVHGEYVSTDALFYATPGSVADDVVRNVVPASTRVAGAPRGVVSRQVRYQFSQLLGFQPRPWGRVRVELLGGIGVQGQEASDYYDAYRTSGRGTSDDPQRTERIPGKYYVLNFETPQSGLVVGLDAEIVLVRGLAAVPMLRYSRIGNPGTTLTYGLGVNWRF